MGRGFYLQPSCESQAPAAARSDVAAIADLGWHCPGRTARVRRRGYGSPRPIETGRVKKRHGTGKGRILQLRVLHLARPVASFRSTSLYSPARTLTRPSEQSGPLVCTSNESGWHRHPHHIAPGSAIRGSFMMESIVII